MGICHSEPSKEQLKSQEIAKMQMADAVRDSELNKFLLLGPGESGKSTLFKQMISLHRGFSDRRSYASFVHRHVINSIQILCKKSKELKVEGTKVDDKNAESMDIILKIDRNALSFPKETGSHIAALWADPGIQTTYEHRTKYYLTDSSAYFLDKAEKVFDPEYIPTDQDIFRCRSRTTGIDEENFEIEGNKFKMIDVGGQRSERKKWKSCFSGVTAILFVVAISEYDMVLFEDEGVNRMHDALQVFEEYANDKNLSHIPVMLFLNKRDLFLEKIVEKKVPLTVCFPEYKPSNPDDPVESAISFIQGEFMKRNKNLRRKIYPHVTCATDPDNVRFVFRSVNDIVIKRALSEGGLLEEKGSSI